MLVCRNPVAVMTITLKHYYIHIKMLWSWQSSHGRGLKGWAWVWDSEQWIMWTDTSTFYLNVSNYRLIDVLTLSNTRCGHMVFLKALNDQCVISRVFKSGLQRFTLFDTTEAFICYTKIRFMWKPYRDHSVLRSTNQSPCCIVTHTLIGCGHTQNNPCLGEIGILLIEMFRKVTLMNTICNVKVI